jgi:hypothetical protein
MITRQTRKLPSSINHGAPFLRSSATLIDNYYGGNVGKSMKAVELVVAQKGCCRDIAMTPGSLNWRNSSY